MSGWKKISELQKGEFFTLSSCVSADCNKVYCRGAYDRSSKKFECYKFSDINASRLLAGARMVFTDFIF